MKTDMDKEAEITDIVENTLIEELAGYYEFLGGKSIIGRIWGLLFSMNEPISLKEIAKKLNISKAAVSINIKFGVDMELFKKVYNSKFPRESFYKIGFISIDELSNSTMKKISMLQSILFKTMEIIKDNKSVIIDDSRLSTVEKRIENLDYSLKIFQEEYIELNKRVKNRIKNNI